MTTRRLLSWWWDYLVVLAWLALTFLLVGLPGILGWLDLGAVWSRPVAADAAITVLTVVPYWLYLTLTEASPAHATWGKRREGLVVVAERGEVTAGRGEATAGRGEATAGRGEVTVGRSAVRNLVKALPWQLAHMGATRLAADAGQPLAMAFTSTSLVLLALVAAPALAGRRGLHDVLAGTAVRPRGE